MVAKRKHKPASGYGMGIAPVAGTDAAKGLELVTLTVAPELPAWALSLKLQLR